MHARVSPVLAGAALAALAACREPHGAGAVVIDDDNCVACHQADYDRTTDPPHAGAFPTTCGDCHATRAWRPALGGGHPEARFPIASGGHQGVACQDCHDPAAGPSTAGANTDCIQCHVQADSDPRHQGVSGYTFQPSMRQFCLTCHPDGTARGVGHPEARFPIATGAHQLPCADCHVAALGPPTAGQNTSCTGCHTGEHSMTLMNEHHREVADYAWSSTDQHFCLECHPDGRNRD
jgi:hypothetical protein